jgi:tetratricopeptide (TPR) repeat protein
MTAEDNTVTSLREADYWPVAAEKYFNEERYSRTVEICREHLESDSRSLSGRIIYARALYHAGQVESAEEQFQRVLSQDPDHLVALKYIGEIKFGAGEEASAFAHWRRLLQLDPECRALCVPIKKKEQTTMRTITLARQPEALSTRQSKNLREIPFYTETVGDLYLSQGHPRLAAEVFDKLSRESSNSRISEKLEKARSLIREREK